eukprot:2677334-Rhodomonas_salina.1
MACSTHQTCSCPSEALPSICTTHVALGSLILYRSCNPHTARSQQIQELSGSRAKPGGEP